MSCLLLAVAKATAAEVRVAVLPVGEEVQHIAEITEQRLSHVPDVALLDRLALETVFAEQALAAAAGNASDAAGRLQLGQLLRADVLILLEQQPPATRVTAIDVATGLRLSRDAVKPRQIMPTIIRSIQQHRRGIREVAAVMPFSSPDLTRTRDHLKDALAAALARRLAKEPGVLVVEVEEARAALAEFAVSAGPLAARRPPATFVDGTFDAIDDDRLRLQIIYRRGKRVETVEHDVDGRAATRWLSRSEAVPDDWFEGDIDPAAAAEAEAVSLFSRAERFATLGDWQQALGLAEAAMVLHDTPQRRRLAAISAYKSAQTMRETTRYLAPDARAAGQVEIEAMDLRGWRHFVSWSRRAAVAATEEHRQLHRNYLEHLGSRLEPEIVELVRADVISIFASTDARQDRDIWIRGIEHLPNRLFSKHYGPHPQQGQDRHLRWHIAPERMAFAGRIAAELARMPSATKDDFIKVICGSWAWVGENKHVRRTLHHMAALDHPAAQAAAAEILGWLDSPWPRMRGRDPATTGIVRSEPRELPAVSGVAWKHVHQAPFTGELCGWLRLDGTRHTDAFWSTTNDRPGRLYLVDPEGEPHDVGDEVYGEFQAVAYDGRWLWYLAAGDPGTRLIALDPQSGQRHVLGGDLGLPPDPAIGAGLVGLEEGSVALSVAIGSDSQRRNYVMIATLDPKPTLQTLLEVREAEEAFVPGSSSLGHPFTPALWLVREDEAATLLVVRGSDRRPLMIDPTPGGAGVLGELAIPFTQIGDFFERDGISYAVAGRNLKFGGIYRLTPDALTVEEVSPVAPPLLEQVVLYQDRLLARSRYSDLLIAPTPDQPFEEIRMQFPADKEDWEMATDARVFVTHRFGLIWNQPMDRQFWSIELVNDVATPPAKPD